MTTPAPERSPRTDSSTLYQISLERLAELKRSAVAMLAARRCASCPSRLRPDHELTDPQELIDEIAEYCADEEEFIRPDMPLQEILFRILVARRNQPMSLYDLHYQLTEQWATPAKPMNITQAGLRRILEADTYYGFAPAD